MKYGLIALQGAFVLLMTYIVFAAAYSLIKRQTFWEKRKYDEKQKKRYLKIWTFVGIVSLILTPKEVMDFVEIWNKLMR